MMGFFVLKAQVWLTWGQKTGLLEINFLLCIPQHTDWTIRRFNFICQFYHLFFSYVFLDMGKIIGKKKYWKFFYLAEGNDM